MDTELRNVSPKLDLAQASLRGSLGLLRRMWMWPNLRKPKLRKTAPTSIQILSDLHLEIGYYTTFTIPPTAPNLILAGDIGRLVDYAQYLSFLVRLAPSYERIFLVLGNHEFYGLTVEEGIERARRLEQEEDLSGKLVLLHQRRFDFQRSDDDLVILGCTLWSHVPEEKRLMVQMKVSDFEKIRDWSVIKHNSAHAADVTWLKDQAKQISQNSSRSRKVTVLTVTHHAPSRKKTAPESQIKGDCSAAFATDLLHHKWWRKAGVEVWLHGHTHFTNDFLRKGIRVVSNQRGYVLPGQPETTDDANGSNRTYDVKRNIQL